MPDALAAWNPWWDEGRVPAALLGRPRRLTATLAQALDGPEIVALAGIRRCGKTTIMLQLVDALLRQGVEPSRILFANLEDPGLDALGLDDLEATLPDGPDRTYMFLDEVQARPGWERWLRVRHDQKVPRKAVVIGSSSELARGDYARLLTGRNLTHTARPLDFPEYLGFTRQDGHDAGALLEGPFLRHGGFPEPVLRDPHRARSLLEQYFLDIIHRDIVARRHLDAERVERLALYLAQAFGGPHTKRKLAKATHIAPDTLRSYLEAMQSAYLVQIVPRLTDSPKPSRETEGPFKVYWTDTGLRNSVVAQPDRDRGTQAENLVATTLASRGARPFFWTDGKGRHEVDFAVVQPDGVVDAYQVWWGEGTAWGDVPRREVDSLHALHAALPRKRRGRRFLLTRRLSGSQTGIEAMPLHAWTTSPP